MYTRYLYAPLGHRLHKQTSYHDHQGRELRPTAHTRYGWDGDRLVMTERDNRQCHTIYSPDSFVPLLRLEGDIPPPVVSLAEKMSQQAEMTFPDIIVQRMHQLERELRQQQLSEESLSWLAMANLTPERLATQLDPLPSLPEKVHIYHCDHLGTPLALVDRRGKIGWQATRDPWGNIVRENNLEHLEQPIGMQGQHYDTESGLYYNRYRYYDPWQGKYITQDPIRLQGGLNLYAYPVDPLQYIDPLGLALLCPSSPPRGDSQWREYVGNPKVFHCGFEGYLENRPPTPADPMNECFYDPKGILVDNSHKYSWCQGTPDQYAADTDPIKHIFIDSGGVVRKGVPAAIESLRYSLHKACEKIGEEHKNNPQKYRPEGFSFLPPL